MSFSATAAGGNSVAIPSGDSITITQGATTLCTITPLSSGAGSCTTTNTALAASGTAYTVTATFNSTGSDTNFVSTATKTTTWTVNKGNQTISFTSTNPSPVTVGGANYTPTATSTSGLTVAITLDPSSTGCVLTSGVVSFPNTGTCVIDVNQIGSGNYNAATQMQQSITINGAGPALVQQDHYASIGAVSSFAIPSSSSFVAGDTLVFLLSYSGSDYLGHGCEPTPPDGISDTQNNTWVAQSQRSSTSPGADAVSEIWTTTAQAGSDTVTVQLPTGSGTGCASTYTVQYASITEWSGLTSGTADVHAGGNATSGTTVEASSITPTHTNDLVIAIAFRRREHEHSGHDSQHRLQRSHRANQPGIRGIRDRPDYQPASGGVEHKCLRRVGSVNRSVPLMKPGLTADSSPRVPALARASAACIS